MSAETGPGPGGAAPTVSFDVATADALADALRGLRARLDGFAATENGYAGVAEKDWRGPHHREFEADRRTLRAALQSAVAKVEDQRRALESARQSAASRQLALNTLHDLWTQDCLRATFFHQPLPPYPDLPN